MFGIWFARWMSFGAVAFVMSNIIHAIITYKIIKTKCTAEELFEKDESLQRAIQNIYSTSFAHFLIGIVRSILLWPLFLAISIYDALQLRDEYLK